MRLRKIKLWQICLQLEYLINANKAFRGQLREFIYKYDQAVF
jgi:hypothetical protein